MRIKRFIAPDMRTALSMVRDEQGPDAVILSNRVTPQGIEVVAATDYDEALVQQALRAAAPGLAEVPAPAPQRAPAPRQEANATQAPTNLHAPLRAAEPAGASRADAIIAALSASPPRDALAARARAVFRLDHSNDAEPALAMAAAANHAAAPTRASALTAHEDVFTAQGFIDASRAPAAPAVEHGEEFRALLARLNAEEQNTNALPEVPAAVAPIEAATPPAPAPVITAPVAVVEPVTVVVPELRHETIAPVANDVRIETPTLRAVAAPVEDPALVAMRTELSMMRELIERQMDQYAIERLRGSAGRAHVFDTLVACGCDESVAQSVASRIDAHLAPAETREPMFAELARMIMVNRAEPIDEGGVVALVGPTGAGKTTTVAKLAARFAARHRARDVALVTTDTERPGAREQLQAHGRRLGITVCEAEGPEGLNQTLDQLADYPLVLVDTAGYAARDRALLGQILWLRTARRVRSLLVLPANAHPHDMAETIRRYRPASPEGVVLTKTDETGRLGAALSVIVKQDLSLAYTTSGQNVPSDIEVADPARLVQTLEKLRRAADNPLMTEDRHAVA